MECGTEKKSSEVKFDPKITALRTLQDTVGLPTSTFNFNLTEEERLVKEESNSILQQLVQSMTNNLKEAAQSRLAKTEDVKKRDEVFSTSAQCYQKLNAVFEVPRTEIDRIQTIWKFIQLHCPVTFPSFALGASDASEKYLSVIAATGKDDTVSEDVKQTLKNYRQDWLLKRVRVYVRFNNPNDLEKMPLTPDEKNRIVTFKAEKYGSFETVFTSDCTNPCMFGDETSNRVPLKFFFDQLADGYSNILFGYGFSGSGKTYSLFGDGSVDGIVQLGTKYLKDKKGCEAKLILAFELWGTINPAKDGGKGEVKETVRVFFSATEEFNTELKKNSSLKEGAVAAHLNITQDSPLGTILEQIEETRREITAGSRLPDTIRITPNNDNSSRSQLFLQFGIFKGNRQISSFTVVDMAGVENPKFLTAMFFKIKFTALLNQPDIPIQPGSWKEDIPLWKKPKLDLFDFTQRAAYARALIYEGFYINETINHLLLYLQYLCQPGAQNETAFPEECKKTQVTQQGREYKLKWDVASYDAQTCLLKPSIIAPTSRNPRPTKDISIIPIMEFLRGKTGQAKSSEKEKNEKPNKFVMLVLMRSFYDANTQTEDKKMRDDEATATLTYAQSALCAQTTTKPS